MEIATSTVNMHWTPETGRMRKTTRMRACDEIIHFNKKSSQKIVAFFQQVACAGII